MSDLNRTNEPPHFPCVVAARADGALLVALNQQQGCVYDTARQMVYPRQGLATLLAQPYWTPYTGNQHILKQWPGSPPAPQFPAPPRKEQPHDGHRDE